MLSARLFIAIYETPGGVMIADFQTRAQGLRFAYNEHGASVASWSVSCGLFEAFSLYNKCRGRHVEITASGHPIWKGRIEDPAIVDGGVSFAAYGYQRALSDVPYTSFLSSTRTDLWEKAFAAQFSTSTPDKYRLETKDGLFIALQRGDTYATGTNLGALMFRIPSGSNGGIYTASFDWACTLPANWELRMQFFDAAYSFIGGVNIATGNGALQSGSTSTSTTNAAVALMFIFNNTGANYTATGETGTQYARLSNVRLKGTNSAALGANEIAGALAIYTAAINPAQLSPSLALIQSPGIDLRDEIYEDQFPSEILNYLASLGDSQTPPRQWEWGVDNDQVLYFRPRGTGRQWFIDILSPDIELTMDSMVNSAYAVYQEAGGRSLRSAVSTDANSYQAYGILRRRFVSVRTTNSTQAATHRDAALADGKDPRPRVRIDASAIYSSSGMRVHPWVARNGDVITIRNLPPTISADVDRLRTFVLSELEFDTETGVAALTPEDAMPTLDVMVARQAAGVTRPTVVLRPPIPQG